MKEDQFAPKLATALRELDCDVLRVETNMDRGVPDMNACFQGSEIWIELKVPGGKKILLRPAQFAWGCRRHSKGGKVRLVVFGETELILYKYPLQVQPCGEYVELMGGESMKCEKIDGRALNFLFT